MGDTMDGYKCWRCFHVVPSEEMLKGEKDVPKCPLCGEEKLVKKMCILDTGVCRCARDTHAEVILCKSCHDPMCPECGSHDVVGVSRVTGYLSDVSGWRRSKKAEFDDRMRYNVGEAFR